MNDKPIKIDLIGSAWESAKAVLREVVGIATIAIVAVALLAALLGTVALYIVALMALGTVIGKLYLNHPITTSVLTCLCGAIGLYVMVMTGGSVVYLVVPVALIILYGLLILPPAGLDLDGSTKYNRSKLYALSIWAVLLLLNGGGVLSLGFWLTTMLPQSIFPTIVSFIVGSAMVYNGIKFAHRQKEYLINPDSSVKKWRKEKAEAEQRAITNVRNEKAKKIKKERAKRFPKPPTPFQKEILKKANVSRDTLKEMMDYTI